MPVTSLSAADKARLVAMIAQHQKVRSRLPIDYRKELDRLTAEVGRQLFAKLPRNNLLASAAQIVGKLIPGLTSPEALGFAEYAIGGIAAATGVRGTAGSSGRARKDTQMSFNMQYLQLQTQLQTENLVYTTISNVLRTKRDTVKNSISNIR